MLLALLFLLDGSRITNHYRCDVIELNHVYDTIDKRHRFTQVIIWNWKPEVNRHHVDAWWIVDTNQLSQLPHQSHNNFRVRRQDGLVASAKSFQETHSDHDRELADRQIWHESRRFRLDFSR
jgi:hypothetical protein